jgi:hypothetical protein
MTAIPSAPQRSGSEAFMLHLRGHRLGYFRKGLEGDNRVSRSNDRFVGKGEKDRQPEPGVAAMKKSFKAPP